ncbi:hypothetical protein L6Q96_10205 [Candidatus Binatia bacterium]|nr:hypothetical protein [Candidatus Binatia bacterium]
MEKPGGSGMRASTGRRGGCFAPVAGLIGVLSVLVAIGGAGSAGAAEPDSFAICKKQRYALCAAANCLVYNEVAYCKCDVKVGASISLPYTIDEGNICAVNRQGYRNGYMMSTYSLPSSVIAGGSEAIYTCPGSTSDGAYAQCDGGFCFESTREQRFPGFARRLTASEIICSCPITVAEPAPTAIGYQIVGPYPCQEAFFDNCNSALANMDTGSKIAVGAPTGTPRILTEQLYGSVPALNHCEPRP